MECSRFKKLLKAWYLQVEDEALAPARMVDFMNNHIEECPTCIMDPEAKKNIAKIITLVLPKDKLKPVSRAKKTVSPQPTEPSDKELNEEAEESDNKVDDGGIDNGEESTDTDSEPEQAPTEPEKS